MKPKDCSLDTCPEVSSTDSEFCVTWYCSSNWSDQDLN